jgi:predicted XRE-type DNA-binding protein
MSHFSLIKIRIKNPNLAMLKRAVEMVAEELGGQVTTTIHDYFGRTMECAAAVKGEVFKRGVGVRVNEKGEVEVVGDFWGVPKSEVERFQQLLVRNYTALALQTALAQLGYQVQVQRVQDKVFLRGVAP